MSRHLAVVVGISDYPGAGNDLPGCVPDAANWAAVLHERDVESTVLVDADATLANVTSALAQAMSRATSGDRVTFTFSGHGSRRPDRDGDEPDHWDETLVLHDAQLADDDLHAVFRARRRGVRLRVFSDSCHSGSVSRLVRASTLLTGEPMQTRPRYLPPDVLLDGAELRRARQLEQRETAAAARPRTGALLLSGCRDDQVSYDARFPDGPAGAMTHCALTVLRQDPAVRADVWAQRTRALLAAYGFDQEPVLSGTWLQKRWRGLD